MMVSNSKVKIPRESIPSVAIFRKVPSVKFNTPMTIATSIASEKLRICVPLNSFDPAKKPLALARIKRIVFVCKLLIMKGLFPGFIPRRK